MSDFSVNAIFACCAEVSMPSPTPMSGTPAYWSRLKTDAASAKSREIRDMSSVTMTSTVFFATPFMSSSKPRR